MNSTDVTLAKRWRDAAGKNIDTSQRIELLKDTRRVTEYLGRKIKEANELKKIIELCNAFIQEFTIASQSDLFPNWIACNTAYTEGAGMKLMGTYPMLHDLFEVVKKQFIHHSINYTSLDTIDQASLGVIRSLNTLPKTHKEIETLYYSQMTSKSLFAMCQTSKTCKKNAFPILVNRLSEGDFRLCGFKKLAEAIKFLGDNCSKLKTLDLENFEGINDQDIKTILENFPSLDRLFLKDALITDESSHVLEKMPQLTTFSLSDCREISDVNFLKKYKSLTSLDLSGCWKISDFSFLEQCETLVSLNLSEYKDKIKTFSFLQKCPSLPSLTSLNLFGNWNLKDLSFLEKCPSLKSLNLSNCYQINDFTFLKNCPLLTDLNLNNCGQIVNTSFLKNCPLLSKLTLWGCIHIKNLDFLKICTSLTSLHISQCSLIEDFDLLENCPNLSILNISGCDKIKNLNFLNKCTSLTSLNLSWCHNINDFSLLETCLSLANLTLMECKQIKNFNFLEKCLSLTKVDLRDCLPINIALLEALTAKKVEVIL